MKRIKQYFSIMILMVVLFISSGVQASHVPSTDVITVQKGDTLYGLSKKHHRSVAEIKKINRLEDSTIYPGQRLLLNSDQIYKVITGSFKVKENALNKKAQLKKAGLTAAISEVVIDGDVHYRVQTGAFTERKNATQGLSNVKKKGFADAYILTMTPLNIMGISAGDPYDAIEKNFGKPNKVTSENNKNSFYYQEDGAGIRSTINHADGNIKTLTVYPQFVNKLNFPVVPFTKNDVIDAFGYPNDIKEVVCYESASCEEIKYLLNGQELTVRVDRDGNMVQFLELGQLY